MWRELLYVEERFEYLVWWRTLEQALKHRLEYLPPERAVRKQMLGRTKKVRPKLEALVQQHKVGVALARSVGRLRAIRLGFLGHNDVLGAAARLVEGGNGDCV